MFAVNSPICAFHRFAVEYRISVIDGGSTDDLSSAHLDLNGEGGSAPTAVRKVPSEVLAIHQARVKRPYGSDEGCGL